MHNVADLWEHYCFYVKKKGLFGAARTAMDRWRSRAFGQWEHMYAVDLLGRDAIPKVGAVNLESFASGDAVPQDLLLSFRAYKSARATSMFLERWFGRGGTLWAYFKDGQLAGVQWTIPHGIEGFYSLPVAADEVIIVAVEVFPPFRGRLQYAVMAEGLYDRLGRAGYRRAYLKVAASNAAMLRSIAKTSATPIGEVYTVRIAGKWLTLWKTLAG